MTSILISIQVLASTSKLNIQSSQIIFITDSISHSVSQSDSDQVRNYFGKINKCHKSVKFQAKTSRVCMVIDDDDHHNDNENLTWP